MGFSITHREGYFEVTLSGHPSIDRITDYCNATIHHDKWQPGARVLADDTNITPANVTVAEVRAIADVFGKYRSEYGNARLAVVIANEMQYGMLRMWGVFVEDKWDVETMLFYSRDEALKWLLS